MGHQLAWLSHAQNFFNIEDGDDANFVVTGGNTGCAYAIGDHNFGIMMTRRLVWEGTGMI